MTTCQCNYEQNILKCFENIQKNVSHVWGAAAPCPLWVCCWFRHGFDEVDSSAIYTVWW